MKCPHCGHLPGPDRIHAGRRARSVSPGNCLCGSPDTPSSGPGWNHWTARGGAWEMELEFEQDRVEKAFGASTFTLWEETD